jgi:hypothetical protein
MEQLRRHGGARSTSVLSAVGIQLGFFAPDPKQARTAYRAFVEEGHRAAERR